MRPDPGQATEVATPEIFLNKMTVIHLLSKRPQALRKPRRETVYADDRNRPAHAVVGVASESSRCATDPIYSVVSPQDLTDEEIWTICLTVMPGLRDDEADLKFRDWMSNFS